MTFNYTMHGVGLKVWKLPANTSNVKVATVTIAARPAPKSTWATRWCIERPAGGTPRGGAPYLP